MWLSYKMGGFPELAEDIKEPNFVDEIAPLIDRYDDAVIGLAKNPKKDEIIPVCLFTVEFAGWVSPHVRWFPWATSRNKIEVTIRFLMKTVENYTTVVHCNDTDRPFFAHLCKYGIMRPVGHVDGFFEDGGKIMMYQVRKI